MKKRSSKAVPTKTHKKKKKPVRNKRVYPNKTKRAYQWDDEKEAARLAELGKNFRGGRLFNGYVREALPMVIIVAVVMVAFLVISVLFLVPFFIGFICYLVPFAPFCMSNFQPGPLSSAFLYD